VNGSQHQLYAPAWGNSPCYPMKRKGWVPEHIAALEKGSISFPFFQPQLFSCPDNSLATVPMKDITALCELLNVIQTVAVYFVYLSSGFCGLDLSYNFSFADENVEPTVQWRGGPCSQEGFEQKKWYETGSVFIFLCSWDLEICVCSKKAVEWYVNWKWRNVIHISASLKSECMVHQTV